MRLCDKSCQEFDVVPAEPFSWLRLVRNHTERMPFQAHNAIAFVRFEALGGCLRIGGTFRTPADSLRTAAVATIFGIAALTDGSVELIERWTTPCKSA